VSARRRYVPNVALYNLRDAAGLTQQGLAEALNDFGGKQGLNLALDSMMISRWERGVVARPTALYRRLLSDYFGVPLADLGLTRPRTADPVLTH
jgi:transcriptional regulator with XRE-family HTH domain